MGSILLTALKVKAQETPNMTVIIQSGGFWNYFDNCIRYVEYLGGESPVIRIPLFGKKWTVICFDKTAQIAIIDGDVTDDDPILPTISNDKLPLAAILITSETKYIDNDIIYDIRPFISLTSKFDITNQNLKIYHNSVYFADKSKMNFINGDKIFIETQDNNIDNRVDVIISRSDSETLETIQTVVPGDIIINEQLFGLVHNIGYYDTFSREDHTHGTPINPIILHNQNYDHSLLHSNINDPTANQKAALQGTFDYPSDTNRYVTNIDPRLTICFLETYAVIETLSFKIVTAELEYASSNNLNHVDRILGITTNSANIGNKIIIRLKGNIVNPTWDWDISKPVYLGLDGELTQIIPEEGFIHKIGIASSSTKLFIHLNSRSIIIEDE